MHPTQTHDHHTHIQGWVLQQSVSEDTFSLANALLEVLSKSLESALRGWKAF